MSSLLISMKHTHDQADIARTISRFFAVRGLIRTQLAHGKKTNPSAWLRVEALRFIEREGAPRAKDVADYFSITAPSATSLITGLVKDGLVARKDDPHDRRAHRFALTAKGKRELARVIARGTALLAKLFDPLSERELAQFTALLDRILAAGQEERETSTRTCSDW